MTPRAAIFFDVGGVILTNGWDRPARRTTVERFGINFAEFDARHQRVVDDFEIGRLTLDEYLDRTVLYEPRPFDRAAFRDAMYGQSRANPESLALLADLCRSGRFWAATLNNESRELNQYRIDRFGLREYFSAFFSSCYLGVRKPDPAIYRLALDVAQRRPGDCIFVDDRPENVAAAAAVGMQGIQFQGAAALRSQLGL